jgi:hypothetical protein
MKNFRIVSTSNRKTITMFATAVTVLIGVGMIANPMQQVNAQGNQTNATNATGSSEKCNRGRKK